MHFSELVNLEYFNGEEEYTNHTLFGEVYKNQDKFLSMKWEQYIEIYERLLRPYLYENKAINLLEIGVQNGGSLETWKKYLPKGSHIYGIDVNPLCNNLNFSSNITFIHGSATDEELVQKHFQEMKFDVIIDDGSHHCQDVITTFELLFSKVKEGGLYIVEDCHSSYWAKYGGEYQNPNSSIEYFKKLVDILHYKYIIDKNVMTIPEQAISKVLNKDIASVQFYDSVIAVEKYMQKRTKNFRNYISQGEAHVVSREISRTIALECSENTILERIYK